MLARKVKEVLSPIASKYVSRTYITSGRVRENGDSIKILYVGDYVTRPYFDDFAYEGDVELIGSDLTAFARLAKQVDKHQPDLVVAHLPYRWAHVAGQFPHYRTFHHVNQMIDVSGDWASVKAKFGRSRKTFANQVESKYGLCRRISKSEEDFDHFYHNMHVPYVTNRFNRDYLELDTYDFMKSYFKKGFLIFVTQDGVDVAGVLCLVEDDSLYFRRVGIADLGEKTDYTKSQMALYYYSITTAREHNVKYMNAMASRPFFNDGVYQSKWRWGADVLKDEHPEVASYFLIPSYSHKVKDFFQRNPTFVEKDGKLFGLLGWEGDSEVTVADDKALRKAYHADGLAGMLLLQGHQETPHEHLF